MDHTPARTVSKWSGRYLFYAILSVLALLKLYLVAGQDIIAMPYDSYQYLWMSDAWYWGNKYSFVRRPSFPLFLGLASNTGMPLRVVFELLYLGSAARLATAIVRLGFPRWSAVLAYLLTILLPYAFVWFDFAMVECLLTPLLVWMSAEFAYALVEQGWRRWLHTVLFAAIWVVAWFARSETVLLEAGAAGAVAVFLIAAALRSLPWRDAGLACLRLFGPALVSLTVASLVVASLNAHYFRRFSTKEDLRAPAFVRAYDDLQDIRSPTRLRYVPFARDQMAIAAGVSPAFREIYGSLQGDIGDTYRRISKNEAGVANDIAGGWLIWAIGEAVYRAGYQDAPSRDLYYRRLARQIEAAARTGKIEMVHFPLAMVDPKIGVWGPYLPDSLLTTADRLIPNHTLSAPRQGVTAPEIVREFNLRANRRAALIQPDAPDPRAARADRALSVLGKLYRPILLGLAALAVPLLLIGGWRRLDLPVLALLAFILMPILGRVGIVALIDASSYPTAGIDRYVMPASGLLPFVIVCVFALIFRTRHAANSEPCRE